MSETGEFLRECGVFFVLTLNGGTPAGRPFGAFMECGEDLYISTGDTKDVYRQLKENPRMQIIALKAGTREWIRITGTATECKELEMKEKMLSECPDLKKRFPCPDAPHFALFRIKVTACERYGA